MEKPITPSDPLRRLAVRTFESPLKGL